MSRNTCHLTFLLIPLLILALGNAGLAQDNDSSADTTYPAPDEFVPVDVIAEMIHYEVPEYPHEAVLKSLSGLVWIKCLVGSDGSVKASHVYKSSGYFSLDEAALVAAPSCKFKPAIQNGEPVAMWVTYKVSFDLSSGSGLPHRRPGRRPTGLGCLVDPVLRVMWDKPVPESLSFTRQTSVYGILLLHEIEKKSHARKVMQKARILINGGIADGLEIGMIGELPCLTVDNTRGKLASAEITDVQPFEAMCEISIRNGVTISRYDYVEFTPQALTEAQQLERGIAAYDNRDYERALDHFIKVRHLADSNAMLSEGIRYCLTQIPVSSKALGAEQLALLEQRIPTHLTIAEAYLRLGDGFHARRYLEKVLAVDKQNPDAQRLLESLKPFACCDSLESETAGEEPSRRLSRHPEMSAYSVPEYSFKFEYNAEIEGSIIKSGRVGIAALIGTSGELLSVELAQSSGDSELDSAAIRAAFDNRFKPAIVCGKPEPVWVSWTVAFGLL